MTGVLTGGIIGRYSKGCVDIRDYIAMTSVKIILPITSLPGGLGHGVIRLYLEDYAAIQENLHLKNVLIFGSRQPQSIASSQLLHPG
jgi:hypothetical protein